VILVVLILALVGMTGLVMASGTRRTYHRTVDIKQAIVLGESALSEVNDQVRRILRSRTNADPAHQDWRQSVLESVSDPAIRAPELQLIAIGTRRVIADGGLPFRIDAVIIRVIGVFPAPGVIGRPRGLVEMSVRVQGMRDLYDLEKVIQKRHVFIVDNADDPRLTSFDLRTRPLGTVIL